ncbi:calcium/sodium antiporter [Candidatus Woesearchaeota archaeon]|nr:calcium/sodium antiporter [Candidatus Woesearchaeota archaeon]
MLSIILLIVGLAALIKSADFLVDGSSSLAKKLNISNMVIGLTIVAFGTSMPELVVNVISAFNNTPQIALGNIIGSNIANLLLVLGITGLIAVIKVKHESVWKEIPFALLASISLIALSKKGFLLREDGIILLCFFAIFLYYILETAKKDKSTEKIQSLTLRKDIILILVGSAGLFLGGKLTVENASIIAKGLGLSEFLISATVIAIGTSLPELITSIIAARKKEIDIAVGNIIGSNIFNTFWIIGITAIIKPFKIQNFMMTDMGFSAIMTAILFLSMFVGRKHEFQKRKAAIFVLAYIGYITFIIIRK